MKILAIESSAVAASVALLEEENLIAQSFQHTGLTHSETLLPMVESLLSSCGMSLGQIDLLGVAAGPGSFTGLRIGVSLVKGLAWGRDLPCAACSTLEAMAWNAVGLRGEICAAMDARRKEVYHGLFSSDGAQVKRLTPDRAVSLVALGAEMTSRNQPLWVVGDGAQLCREALVAHGVEANLAPPNLRMQSAWGVGRLALEYYRRGETLAGGALTPTYLRLSQAEREKLEREKQGKGE